MWRQHASLTLPSGVWLNGEHYRNAVLRPLCGEDELSLVDRTASLVERVTILLSRCLVALDALSPVPEAVTDALAVGDREALLLKLWGLTYGARLDGILHCTACSTKMDLDLSTDQLLLPPYQQPAPFYERTWDHYTVTFRLPNGADQQAVTRMPLDEAEAALLRRCVLSVLVDGQPTTDFPESIRVLINQAMLDCDPQGELKIDIQCPDCGANFSALFDTAQYILRDIEQRVRLLAREIHVLALSYHWSEAEILSLPYLRRQMYLGLLDERNML